MTDNECIALLKDGKTEGLEALIDSYGGYFAKVLQSFLGSGLSQQDLEEIASDVFFALWQRRLQLHECDSLKGYIATIARNTGRKRLRKLKYVEPLSEDLTIASQEPTPEESAERSEEHKMLFVLLGTLSEQDREIFYRYYYCKQTTGEIAKIMQINRATVMSRLARGRTSMRARKGAVQG